MDKRQQPPLIWTSKCARNSSKVMLFCTLQIAEFFWHIPIQINAKL